MFVLESELKSGEQLAILFAITPHIITVDDTN